MKTFRHFAFGLFVASLFVTFSAVVSFAGGVQDDERAGYQGIPVRNGLNRGVIQHDNSYAVQRYPRLPRRPNETDIESVESAATGRNIQAHNQNDQRPGDIRGYSGIPQGNRSEREEIQTDENLDMQAVEHAGYSGIPQRVFLNREKMRRRNTFVAQRDSAVLSPK